MAWRKFAVCALLGYLGAHKFMEKKIGQGFLYLFTLGLFGVGWIVDTIRCFIAAFKGTKNKKKAAAISAAVVAVLMIGSVNSQNGLDVASTASPGGAAPAVSAGMLHEAESTAAPTQEPAAEPTAALTREPAAEPTAVPTQEPEEAFVLNKNTRVFHEPGCSSVKKMSEKNRLDFCGTRQEAIDMGYKPCGRCDP